MRSITVFDDFYNTKIDTNSTEYDLASSFFSSVFTDQEVARSFTATLFRVATETGEQTLSILDKLSGKDQVELSLVMAFYLNQIRPLSALLGVEVPPQPNVYVARNVLP